MADAVSEEEDGGSAERYPDRRVQRGLQRVRQGRKKAGLQTLQPIKLQKAELYFDKKQRLFHPRTTILKMF